MWSYRCRRTIDANLKGEESSSILTKMLSPRMELFCCQYDSAYLLRGRYLTDIDSKQHAVHAPQYTVYNADSPKPLFPSQSNAQSQHGSVRPALYLSACGSTVLHTTSISPNARPHAPGPMNPFLACISASSISTHNPLTSALEVDLPPSHIHTPCQCSPYSQSLIQ